MREHPIEKGLVTRILFALTLFGIMVLVLLAYPYIKARIPYDRQVTVFMNGDWRVGEVRKCSTQDAASLDCPTGEQAGAQENSRAFLVRFNEHLASGTYGTTSWNCTRKESLIACELGNSR